MSIWIIEPHDPLLFRDGRPFGASPGAIARSLPFPFPSTIAGGLRSQMGLDDQGRFRFTEKEELEHLKKVGVRGPILVQLPQKAQEKARWLVPAPLDALPFEIKKGEAEEKQPTRFTIEQLVPLTPLAEVMTDLDTGEQTQQSLWLVGLPNHRSEKPSTNTPAYWYWERFLAWLENPKTDCWKTITAPALGIKGPATEERVHVAMDHQTHTGRDGFLFATSSLEFTANEKTEQQEEEQQPPSLAQARQLGLAVIVDEKKDINDEALLQPQYGLGCLGSERRLVNWSPSQENIPCCPDTIKQSIIANSACRLVLLTPAYFAQGYLPQWILNRPQAIKPQLKAMVNKRPQVVSGWDIVKKERKQSHRLAPAGTILFLELQGDEPAIEEWIDEIWLHCISDDDNGPTPDQYRLDGFGLAALGTWIDKTLPLRIDSDPKGKQ
ncbi:type III-B CRISPR module-associated protein Cmr3 [Dictyobacter arantiisoli]|uniref:CRISPR-associated protein Cmr3 n=1 Tax=Dictyobacter arantiisoli TaxID=2014874 RepID=A0A5A5TFU4_9CHLR|nr:type III-B CRISPR module-associated protein Cmr3 [Dictyobacter arantiisoli]GCF10227.1 CRISPR-associated protein Cmr3 [Dictyobacter arantiisoli]